MNNGWDESASAWIASVDGFEYTRKVLLDPVMLGMCGPVDGLSVLDVGCGEGRFCRMLGSLGAKTVGLDLTLALVESAVSRDSEGFYFRANGEVLPIASDSFDLVVSYLVLIDIPDFRASIREMTRVLKPGGRLVIGNLAPHASTTETGWMRDDLGNRTYFPIIDYLDERAQRVAWKGISIVNYHRPLEAYMSTLLGAGLILRGYREPAPSLEHIAANPACEVDRKVPYVHAMLWEKGGP
ncbi:MAG TPA: class I SAM-dependent methyltransferase [Fimbriimonadaceae bacterium]|jgi:SAM-dependent methyltransferase